MGLRSMTLVALLSICLAQGISGALLYGQPGNLLGGNSLIPGLTEEEGLEPEVSIRFSPEKAAIGDTVQLEIAIKTGDKAYVYSQNPNVGAETRIELQAVQGLKAVTPKFEPNKEPKVVIEPLFNNAKLEKFYGGVVWSQSFQVTAANPQVKGRIDYQVCDEATCNPGKEEFSLTLTTTSANKTPTLKMILGGANEPTDEVVEAPVVAPIPAADNAPLPLVAGNVIARQTITPERQFSDSKEPVVFDLTLIESAAAGQPLQQTVVVTAKITGKWHIYALEQDPKMFALPTVIQLNTPAHLKPIDPGFRPDHAAKVSESDLDGMKVVQKYHEEKVSWQQRFAVDSATIQEPITGSVRYQICEEGSCLPPLTFDFELQPGSISEQTLASADAPVEEENAGTGNGLIPFLITGIIAGYFALLTPCVFPMIPITVSFFLKQSEKENHKPLFLATIYCLGIITTFTLFGLIVTVAFGEHGLTQLANNVWGNIFLTIILIFFGLNMLGLFEIQVPSSLLNWSSSKERQGGVIGVIFMAVTFSLVSFTCTFAFVGGLLALFSQGDYLTPLLGMLAFSTAFASPFFVLALVPSMLKKLPKSGGWMNTIKVVLGFLEIGAALKFASVADFGIFSEAYLFDYGFVMTSWMVLSLLAGFYLLGLYRLPHDSEIKSIGVVRLGFAAVFLGLTSYLAAGIYGAQKPTGILWEPIAAFAPPQIKVEQDVDLGLTISHDELAYALDVDQAIKFASANNQPLFFDFTGTNCVNCRFMEINVMSLDENRELLENFVRVQLYTDVVPKVKDPTEAEALLTKNRKLQAQWYQDVTLPAYAIVTPDGQTILSRFKGAERNKGQFTRFLESGLEEWQRVKTANAGATTRR